MKNLLLRIITRWAANAFGLWIAARIFPTITFGDELAVIITAGLILSITNTFLKPLVVILSLPAIVFSLGLFMIIINGFMVWLASILVNSFEVEGFGSAVLAGIIIGLVNYALTTLLEDGKVLKKE